MKNLRWADKYKLGRIAAQLKEHSSVAVFETSGSWQGLCMNGVGADKVRHLLARDPGALIGIYRVTPSQDAGQIIEVIVQDLMSVDCITIKKRGVTHED